MTRRGISTKPYSAEAFAPACAADEIRDGLIGAGIAPPALLHSLVLTDRIRIAAKLGVLFGAGAGKEQGDGDGGGVRNALLGRIAAHPWDLKSQHPESMSESGEDNVRRLCESRGLASFLQLLCDRAGWSDSARSGRMPFQGVVPPPAPPDVQALVAAGRAVAALAEMRHSQGGIGPAYIRAVKDASGDEGAANIFGGARQSTDATTDVTTDAVTDASTDTTADGLLQRCVACLDAHAFPTLHAALTAALTPAEEEIADEDHQMDYRTWRRARLASSKGDCGVTAVLSPALPAAALRYVAAAADVAQAASSAASGSGSGGGGEVSRSTTPVGGVDPAAWEAALRGSLDAEFLAWHVGPTDRGGAGPDLDHSVLGTAYHLRQGRALAALESVLLARAEDVLQARAAEATGGGGGGGLHQLLQQQLHAPQLTAEEWNAALREPLSAAVAGALLAVAAAVAAAHHGELAACAATATALQLAGVHPAPVRVDAASLRLLSSLTSPAHAAVLAAPLAAAAGAGAAGAAAAGAAGAAAAVADALEDALAEDGGGGGGGGDPESEAVELRARSARWALASALRRRHGLSDRLSVVEAVEEGKAHDLVTVEAIKTVETVEAVEAVGSGLHPRWVAELGAAGDWITLLVGSSPRHSFRYI